MRKQREIKIKWPSVDERKNVIQETGEVALYYGVIINYKY